jgi:hypothetical protein
MEHLSRTGAKPSGEILMRVRIVAGDPGSRALGWERFFEVRSLTSGF